MRILNKSNNPMITMYKFLQSESIPQTDIIKPPHFSKTPTLALATTLTERLFGDPPLTIKKDTDKSKGESITFD